MLGGNSNWNRERDLSSARDVCRGEPSSFVEQKVCSDIPISKNLYFDRNAKCVRRNFGTAVSVSEIVTRGGGGEGGYFWILLDIFWIHRNFIFNPSYFRLIGSVDPSKNVHGLFITVVCRWRDGGLSGDWLVSRDTRRGAIDKTRGHSRGCS